MIVCFRFVLLMMVALVVSYKRAEHVTKNISMLSILATAEAIKKTAVGKHERCPGDTRRGGNCEKHLLQIVQPTHIGKRRTIAKRGAISCRTGSGVFARA